MLNYAREKIPMVAVAALFQKDPQVLIAHPGQGNDTFEFQRSEGDQPAVMVRKITDFTVGDRIVAATYEISYLQEEGAADHLSDMFSDIYLSADGDHHRPVRFRRR